MFVLQQPLGPAVWGPHVLCVGGLKLTDYSNMSPSLCVTEGLVHVAIIKPLAEVYPHLSPHGSCETPA